MGQRKKSRKKPERLGEKLLAIRLQLGVSQSQLAKLLEFDKGTARISEYENGVREPQLTVLLKYARLVRISLEMLVDDNIELTFPKNWKMPRRVTEFLTQQRRMKSQNTIDNLRRKLSRSL